jgi:hypothetical protein
MHGELESVRQEVLNHQPEIADASARGDRGHHADHVVDEPVWSGNSIGWQIVRHLHHTSEANVGPSDPTRIVISLVERAYGQWPAIHRANRVR